MTSGVSMRGLRFEIWGGQESSFKSTCAEPPAGPSTAPPAAASGIGFPLEPTCGGSPISSTVDALAPRSQGRHRAQVGAPQLDNLANLTANAPEQLVPRSKPIVVVNPVAATSRRRSRNLEPGCGPAWCALEHLINDQMVHRRREAMPPLLASVVVNRASSESGPQSVRAVECDFERWIDATQPVDHGTCPVEVLASPFEVPAGGG